MHKADVFGETAFLWNGDVLLSETRRHWHKLYVYEPDSFRPLVFVQNKRVYYYHLDHLGTPQEMTDVKGQVVWNVRYRAYGNVVEKTVEQVENNLRFQGQYFDAETGLHYNRFRYYDPQVGRFIHQDPFKLAGGENFYWYVPNPIRWIDIFGLQCKEILDNPVNFNRGSRKFYIEQGTARSGWKHIFDRHVDPNRFPKKSKFDDSLNQEEILVLLNKTLKHGRESSYAGKAIFEKRLKVNGNYKKYRATVNPDGSVQTFHPLD